MLVQGCMPETQRLVNYLLEALIEVPARSSQDED